MMEKISYDIKRLLIREESKQQVSLRIKTELLERIDRLAVQAKCSRNKLVNVLLKIAIDIVEIEE